MATAAFTPHRSARPGQRFYVASAIAMVLVTFIGFVPTYYLAPLFHAPPLPWVVHAHGLVFSLWVLFYLLQTALVARGSRDLHRVIGPWGGVLAVLVLALGVAVAIEGARRGAGPTDRDQTAFLIYPMANIAAFAIFCTLAIAKRGRAETHKRLMLLAMTCIVVTPLARISKMLGSPFAPPIGGMILSDLFVVALVAHDLRTRGRLHPVTAYGGGALLLSELLRVVVGGTDAWRAVALQIIG